MSVCVVGEMALLFRKAFAASGAMPMLLVSSPRFIWRSSAGTLVAQRSLQGCGPIESVDRSASRATDRAHPETDRKLSEEGWPRHLV